MIQEIITYLIITSAFGVLIYNVLRFFNLAGKKTSTSSKCTGCSGAGCEVKEFRQLTPLRKSKKNQYQYYL